MKIVRAWKILISEISKLKILRKIQQRKMRQTIFDDEDLHSERSVLLERSITPRSFIQNEYAASEISCESKKGFDMCHIMEEEDSLAGDDQVKNIDDNLLLLKV